MNAKARAERAIPRYVRAFAPFLVERVERQIIAAERVAREQERDAAALVAEGMAERWRNDPNYTDKDEGATVLIGVASLIGKRIRRRGDPELGYVPVVYQLDERAEE